MGKYSIKRYHDAIWLGYEPDKKFETDFMENPKLFGTVAFRLVNGFGTSDSMTTMVLV